MTLLCIDVVLYYFEVCVEYVSVLLYLCMVFVYKLQDLLNQLLMYVTVPHPVYKDVDRATALTKRTHCDLFTCKVRVKILCS